VAIYRLSVQIISRSHGRTATAAAAYRSGSDIVDERTGILFSYRRRRGVADAWIQAPLKAPEWATVRKELWNRVEAAERRRDAQLCREIQLALPHELTTSQRRELLEGWVDAQCVSHGMIADIAIHEPDANGDQRNHHAHVLLTLRRLDGDRFSCRKATEWNSQAMLLEWRRSWARACNTALLNAGSRSRVNHRRLSDGQRDGAKLHVGPAVNAIAERGEESTRIAETVLLRSEVRSMNWQAAILRRRLRGLREFRDCFTMAEREIHNIERGER